MHSSAVLIGWLLLTNVKYFELILYGGKANGNPYKTIVYSYKIMLPRKLKIFGIDSRQIA